MSRSIRKIKPPSMGLPTGWTALARACRTPTEADLLETLARRADRSGQQLTSIEQLGALAQGIDELTLLGQLVERIHEKFRRPIRQDQLSGYDRHKERARLRQSKHSLAGRDIGALPPVADPDRREACARDLKLSLRTYWPEVFPLEFSENQQIMIARAQLVILVGALFAVAMPRGEGKTVTCRAAVQWAINNAHARFAYLIGATDEKAVESLEIIRADYETNPLLLADFPEICYPLWKLEGIHNRCKGQLHQGQRTRIGFGKKQLVLPTIAGAASSGSLIKAGGLLSSLRGAAHRLASGEIIRPDLIVPDDPQTRESAESPPQNATRLRIITADILGMAGPGGKIAALMPCTVIARGDMVDTVLDNDRHPEWNGLRTSMLQSFPERMDLWEDYWDLLMRTLKSRQTVDDPSEITQATAIPIEATRFYRKHRKEMDRGARAGWKQRHRDDELSAIQHAMNLFLRDPEAFYSEYQNDPRDPNSDEEFLDAGEISGKINNYARGEVPLGVEWLTCFIDCHKRSLVWMVCGWEWNFSGYIIDYGTFPESARERWKMASFRPTLAQKFPKSGDEGALYQGLCRLGDELLSRRFLREDGAEMQIARGLIDQGYQHGTIQRVIRERAWLRVLFPAFGKSFAPGQTTINEYRQRAGETLGDNWNLKRTRSGKLRNLMFDANAWKTFAARRLASESGNPGCVSLFGFEPKAGKIPRRSASHEFLAQQLDSEVRTVVMDGDRAIQLWSRKPSSENHYLDAYVGCCVAASMCGARIAADRQAPKQSQRRSKSLAERRAEKRRRR